MSGDGLVSTGSAPFDPTALPPLREVIAAHGLDARKALGQNFLLDLNLTGRIARAAGDLDGVTVVEVGPGPGGLTRMLLARPEVAKVVAIERDPRCIAALQDMVEAAGGRLEIVAGDALTVDMTSLAPPPRTVVANLPYNIATPLLLGWLKDLRAWTSLTLMFQKEVADRLVASQRSRAYGRLSVMTQWVGRPALLFTLPARAFVPPPKIVSAVVRIEPRPEPPAVPWAAMEAVVAAAFGQRRKTLRQSLSTLTREAEALLQEAGLPPTARAEEIDVAGFMRLAAAWAARGGS